MEKNVPNHQPALNHHIKPAFTSRFTPPVAQVQSVPQMGNPVVSRCFGVGGEALRSWHHHHGWNRWYWEHTHTHIYIYLLYIYIYVCVCDGNTIGSMQWDWHNGTYWLTTVTSTGLVHNSPQWIQQGIQHVSIYNWRYNPLRHRIELKKLKQRAHKHNPSDLRFLLEPLRSIEVRLDRIKKTCYCGLGSLCAHNLSNL